jgi:hypothetical protein
MQKTETAEVLTISNVDPFGRKEHWLLREKGNEGKLD